MKLQKGVQYGTFKVQTARGMSRGGGTGESPAPLKMFLAPLVPAVHVSVHCKYKITILGVLKSCWNVESSFEFVRICVDAMHQHCLK